MRSGGSVFCVNYGRMCDVVWFDAGLLLPLRCWTPGDVGVSMFQVGSLGSSCQNW